MIYGCCAYQTKQHRQNRTSRKQKNKFVSHLFYRTRIDFVHYSYKKLQYTGRNVFV